MRETNSQSMSIYHHTMCTCLNMCKPLENLLISLFHQIWSNVWLLLKDESMWWMYDGIIMNQWWPFTHESICAWIDYFDLHRSPSSLCESCVVVVWCGVVSAFVFIRTKEKSTKTSPKTPFQFTKYDHWSKVFIVFRVSFITHT